MELFIFISGATIVLTNQEAVKISWQEHAEMVLLKLRY